MVQLIASTKTHKDLAVSVEIDRTVYPPDFKVADERIKNLKLETSAFHDEWNYTIRPRTAP